jgi:[ribosomal protein S18]-alanine N-acetyltransferase
VSATHATAIASIPEIVWRPMREADVAAVAAIEGGAHVAAWTAGNFRDALAAGYSATVGEANGIIVAYGVLMLAPGEAQLLSLTVADALRRRGIGRELLQRFLGEAAARGADQCFLEVRISNAAAISLYTGAGFVPVARRAGYYPATHPDDAREDALVLRRALREQP